MADRVVLHIGTMKSGTSFLQSALMANRKPLRKAGYRFLGKTFGKQTRAVRDVLGKDGRKSGLAAWTELAEEARAFKGEAGIVSMEFLSFARRPQIAAFLEPLAGMEVEVLITVRDQFRAIPAQWQTYTRNFGTDDWATYLQRIRSDEPEDRRSRAVETFTRAQDVATMVERWNSQSQVAQTVVVTVPDPTAPREELWERFCAAVGIPTGRMSLEGLHSNPSVGYASCDLLRRMNTHLGDVRPKEYRNGVRPLTREVLVPLRAEESRPELDRESAAFARALNERIRSTTSSHSLPMIGSLDELPLPDDLSAYPEEVPPAPEPEVRRAAEAAWQHLAGRLGVPEAARPTDLDTLAEDTAALLRRLRGW